MASTTGLIYYLNGAIKSFTHWNVLTRTTTQNGRQWPLRVIDTGNVLDHEYGYNQNGNVISLIDRIDSNRSRWMTYVGLDRLTSAVVDAPQVSATLIPSLSGRHH